MSPLDRLTVRGGALLVVDLQEKLLKAIEGRERLLDQRHPAGPSCPDFGHTRLRDRAISQRARPDRRAARQLDPRPSRARPPSTASGRPGSLMGWLNSASATSHWPGSRPMSASRRPPWSCSKLGLCGPGPGRCRRPRGSRSTTSSPSVGWSRAGAVVTRRPRPRSSSGSEGPSIRGSRRSAPWSRSGRRIEPSGSRLSSEVCGPSVTDSGLPPPRPEGHRPRRPPPGSPGICASSIGRGVSPCACPGSPESPSSPDIRPGRQSRDTRA